MNLLYRVSLLFLLAAGLLFATSACKNGGTAGNANKPDRPLNHLLERYLKPYPDELSAISQSDKDTAIINAMNSYNAGRYEEAIALFPNSARSLEQAGYVQLYQGIAQLMADKEYDAFETLQRIQSSMGKPFEISDWYLTLNYVAFNNVYEARQKLEKIIAAGAYPGDDAKALLKDLPKKE